MNGYSNKTNVKPLHIGFDDTDSVNGRCTTHLSYLITKTLLERFQVEFLDLPLLVRLNPNVPLKTRGNGAVCLRIRGRSQTHHERIRAEIAQMIENYSEIGNGANPGIVFYENDTISNDLIQFSENAMDSILSKQLAIKIAKNNNIEFIGFGKEYGLVGALAAVGCTLNSDHTFETIAYRSEENLGTHRDTDWLRVKKLSEETYPYTYNNFDQKNFRVLITPHGPDPVFCGIRGEDPLLTSYFLKNLCIKEQLDGYMIFRTNQGTNLHLTREKSVQEIMPFMSGVINCKVISTPLIIKGGHVIFKIKDKFNKVLPVAVYQPTGLTKLVSLLHPGDRIEVGYGVHLKSENQLTLNLEYLIIKELVKTYEEKNPICNKCLKNMKSEGMNKGYQCKRCKSKNRSKEKLYIETERKIRCGLYIPEPIAHRHLTKPINRYGMEKSFDRLEILNIIKTIKWIEK